MAFLLGSFTGGLFGGFNEALGAFDKWEQLKQRRMETKYKQTLMDAAEEAAAGLKADRERKPPGISTTTEATTPKGGEYSDVDIEALPPPKFMAPTTSQKLAAGVTTGSKAFAGALPSPVTPVDIETTPSTMPSYGAMQPAAAPEAPVGMSRLSPADAAIRASKGVAVTPVTRPRQSIGSQISSALNYLVPPQTGRPPESMTRTSPAEQRARGLMPPAPPAATVPTQPAAMQVPTAPQPVIVTLPGGQAMPAGLVAVEAVAPTQQPTVRIPTARYDEYGNLLSY